MNNRKIFISILLLFAILLIIAAAIFFLVPKKDEEKVQILKNSSPVQVQIINPFSGSDWPLNYSIPIEVSVWGKAPISKAVLYINGEPSIEKIIDPDQSEKIDVLTYFNWQPPDIGDYILTVQGYDKNGGNGISDPVFISAFKAVGSRSPVVFKEGDTLEKIAIDNDISLEEISQANPDIDPQLVLDPSKIIFIPNAPLFDLKIINTPPLVPVDSGEQFSDDPAEDPETGQNHDLPYAPVIYTKYDGCDVKLRIENIGYFNDTNDPNMGQLTKEEGFYLYRSRDGGTYEQIATFPARITFDTDVNDFYEFTSDWSYIDGDQFGYLTYYFSAFNANGESASTPVVVPLNKANCSDPNQDPALNILYLDENGDLVSPLNLDTAYLYIQVNDGQAFRVPEGNRFFLPNSGMKFNIFDYLDSISSGILYSDIKLHMEVWGWLAGQLIHVGDIDQFINRSVLSICSAEGQGSCDEGGPGQWIQEMNILADSIKPLNEQKYDIRWQITELTTAHKICLGISMREFYGEGITDTSFKLLYSCNVKASDGSYPGGNEGVVTLDFGKLLYPEDPSAIKNTLKPGDDYQYPNFEEEFPIGSPFTMYLRFVAGVDDYQFQDTSNTAIMHYQTQTAPPDLPPLASDIPSLYDVEILQDTYKEPSYEIWEKSGCIIVDHDPSGKYPAGKELCPMTYIECGVNVECSGFWDYIGAGWDLIVNMIEDAKGFISDSIASTIPGCSGSELCKDTIEKGVDYGVTALTGIPPDIPNFEELAAQGVTESIIIGLTDISGEDVEYVCGDACKDEITKQILPYIKQARNYYSQPACINGGHYGFFPPCLDPSIDIHPSNGSADFPAFVMVRVTRKTTPESLAVDQGVDGKIKLHLIVDGENPSGAGLFFDICKYQPAIPLEQLPDPDYPGGGGLANWQYSYLGDNGLSEPIYYPVDITIPWLEPGQSIDIPVKLVQTLNNYSPNCAIYNARSQQLFFGGTSHMQAVEYCYSSGSSWDWVPCMNGGQDLWDFANPTGP